MTGNHKECIAKDTTLVSPDGFISMTDELHELLSSVPLQHMHHT